MPLTRAQLHVLSNEIQSANLQAQEEMRNAEDPFAVDKLPAVAKVRELHDQYAEALDPAFNELIEQRASGLITTYEFATAIMLRSGIIYA